MSTPTRISVSSLPKATSLAEELLDTSFFLHSEQRPVLPIPSEVRTRSSGSRLQYRPSFAKFEEFGLIVKFGAAVTIEEAQCLWVVKRMLHDVPVPEVYGWRMDGNDVFIYMQLIHGVTLEERWDTLSESDKLAVCSQLRQIVTSLRRLEQEEGEAFIGSINRGALTDIVFEDQQDKGPFQSVHDFNNWFSKLPQSGLPSSRRYEDPYRCLLPDNAAITFTHGDLHRGNILVAAKGIPSILGIVDWAHGGWYPDYWEYCKAAYTSLYNGAWRNTWIPKFHDPRPEEHFAFGEYIMAIGAV